MIRINLLGEKVDHSATYALQGVLYVGSLILTLFVLFLLHDGVSSERNSLADDVDSMGRRLKKLEEVTKKVNDLETKKKTLKEKLTTIAVLKKKKNGPVHIVDDFNTALPEKAWVTEVSEKEGSVFIKGIALDNQTIAEFMARIGEFSLFDRDKIELVKSSEFLRDNIKLKEFNLIVPLKVIAPPVPKDAEEGSEDDKPMKKKAKKKEADRE